MHIKLFAFLVDNVQKMLQFSLSSLGLCHGVPDVGQIQTTDHYHLHDNHLLHAELPLSNMRTDLATSHSLVDHLYRWILVQASRCQDERQLADKSTRSEIILRSLSIISKSDKSSNKMLCWTLSNAFLKSTKQQ